VLPVEDPWNEKLADQRRDGWELRHRRWDVQAAVDEVAEGVDFVLKVRFSDPSVHLLQFFNWKARSAQLLQDRGSRFLP
jgi:hypothetical protein